MDDTFAIFNTPTACPDFLVRLNALHHALKLTCETEQSNVLPFLDVRVEKTEDGFLTTIYRKATFTGQYTRWDSFSSTRYKIALMSTLVNRVWAICSPCRPAAEFEHIITILHDNGLPK